MRKIRENPEILEAMGDEFSKYIYVNRIAYSNGEKNALWKIVSTVNCLGQFSFIDFMERHKADLYIYDSGELGQYLASTWKEIYNFKAFVDDDMYKVNQNIFGIPVISPQEIECDEATGIIVVKPSWKENVDQLRKRGMMDDQLFDLRTRNHQLKKLQYFDLEYLNLGSSECFADCGAFDGKTSLNLCERFGTRIKKIWLFEPDLQNVKKCECNLNKTDVDYEIIKKGVWSCQTMLNFNYMHNDSSAISRNGDGRIETVRLDDALKGNLPTYIKMDVEGAELEALKGAEKMIGTYHPKLAISVYHKKEDIDEIPKFILSIDPNYKFYLRHYSFMQDETVLYAL